MLEKICWSRATDRIPLMIRLEKNGFREQCLIEKKMVKIVLSYKDTQQSRWIMKITE